VPILHTQGKPHEQKRNDLGPTVILNSVFRKLMNPLHTTRSRVDCPGTVHWHDCLHQRPIDATGIEGRVNGGSSRMVLTVKGGREEDV
jgi:hypothetical protein